MTNAEIDAEIARLQQLKEQQARPFAVGEIVYLPVTIIRYDSDGDVRASYADYTGTRGNICTKPLTLLKAPQPEPPPQPTLTYKVGDKARTRIVTIIELDPECDSYPYYGQYDNGTKEWFAEQELTPV